MVISGKYEVQSQLGQGTMGLVYKVRHTLLDTILALKVLPAHLMENPELVKRFYREARVMARLNHPNIARVIDIHRDDTLQFHYFVMEYIQGQTLRQHLQDKGVLPLLEIVEICRQVARALDYAHNYNPPIIHRDIKPTNIMIEDGSWRVVVMDFGIAKELGESEMTRAGTMLGTLKYCPPEQMRHEALDGSADVYALGMVMYEAYTGAHLFAGLNENEVIRRVLNPEESEPSFTRPMPSEFVAIIKKAIAKSREKRYRCMADLLADLDTYCSDLDETKTNIIPAPARPGSQRGQRQEDLSGIEEQIHKLEEERERHLILLLQAQVRESREKAAREGGVQWAAELFQQGCAREESGFEHFHRRHYDQAREAYQDAANLFAQACEKAIAEALVQRAVQARENVAAAKLEADRYEARKRARSLYSRGLTVQAQADELWDHQSYREAWQLYGEARNLYEDAHELAYRALIEEEAKAAQAQSRAAREQAIKEAAEEFAAEAFWGAVRSERQADTALGQEEFIQARDLYREALQRYELARHQGRSEQQRREAVSACEQAKGRQQRATAAGAGPEWDAYRQAQEAQRRGDAHLEGGDYGQAVAEYSRACDGYEQAGQEAELKAAREAAEAVRQRLTEARARTGALRPWGQAAWARAEQEAREAEAAWEAQAYGRAVELYERALRANAQAQAAAEQERAHQQALGVKRQAEEGQHAAEEAQALRYAGELYERAVAALRRGDERLKANRWEHASEQFAQASALFAESLQAARREQEREAAIAAKEAALAARAEAQAGKAAELFQEQFTEALTQLGEAEREFKEERYATALTLFDKTTALFRRISEEAVAHVQREETLTARARAQEFQEKTVSVSNWRQQRRARKSLEQGDRWFRKGDFERARKGYEEAAVLYAELLEEASAPRAARKDTVVSVSAIRYLLPLLGLGSVVIAYLYLHPLSRETPTKTAEPAKPIEPAKPAEPPQDILPAITKWTPELDSELTLAEGQSQSFVVSATSPQKLPLQYSWYLDGEKRAEGEAWTYQPDFTEAGTHPKDITIRVTDTHNRVTQKSWRVRVLDVNRRPTLEEASPPGESLEMAEGDTREFSVRAVDPDPDDHLLYVWSLDGKKVAEGERWQFRATSPEGTHKLIVAAVDRKGLTASKAWDITIKAPVLPPVSPPEITQAIPEVRPGKEVTVDEGQSLSFSVKARSPQQTLLRYTWFLNGKKQTARAAQWTYKPGFSEADERAKEVKVVVTDPEDHRAEKVWRVRVQDVNQPPKIIRASPSHTEPVTIVEGEAQGFSIEASDPDKGDTLAYVWSFNGQEVAREKSWQLRPPFSTGRHTVAVSVSDKAGLRSERAWNVVVRAPSLPPSITDFRPRDTTVTLDTAQALDFTVTATVPGGTPEAHSKLRYQWSLDSAPPSITEKGQFRLVEPAPGTHRLMVAAISPEGLKSASKSWVIEVRPQDTGIKEAEVRNWLEMYRQAWEEKNVDALVKLGEVASQRAAKLHDILHGYNDFAVALQDVKIQIEGNQATVTLKRVDTIDGKTLVQPDKKVFVLEKQGDGRIVRRMVR